MKLLSSLHLFWLLGAALLVWAIPERFRKLSLIAVTFVYLLIYSPLSAVLLLLLSLITFYGSNRYKIGSWKLILLIILLIAVFTYFKVQDRTGFTDDLNTRVIPLGLSYYIFRLVHYLFERYKKNLPRHKLSEFLNYMFFLPTLLVGPINRFNEFHREFDRRRWNTAFLTSGMERILLGLTKIVIMGNFLISEKFVGWLNGLQLEPGFLAGYLDGVRHWVNLYFQFSGYSDVAIGFALIIGLRISENFNFPFLARNVNEFWKRWHISLSSMCRDYVYTPIASATRKPFLAVIVAMLVMAFWHEISLRFVIWGFYHGLGIAIWHIFSRLKSNVPTVKNKMILNLYYLLSILLTVNFIILSSPVSRYLSELIIKWLK